MKKENIKDRYTRLKLIEDYTNKNRKFDTMIWKDIYNYETKGLSNSEAERVALKIMEFAINNLTAEELQRFKLKTKTLTYLFKERKEAEMFNLYKNKKTIMPRTFETSVIINKSLKIKKVK